MNHKVDYVEQRVKRRVSQSAGFNRYDVVVSRTVTTPEGKEALVLKKRDKLSTG
jgi:hypothetical protein